MHFVHSLLFRLWVTHSIPASLWTSARCVYGHAHECMRGVCDCDYKAKGTPGLLPISSAGRIEPPVKPCQISASTGFQSVKMLWVYAHPSRLRVDFVTHFSAQKWKLYHLLSPYQSLQRRYQCFPSVGLMRGPKARLLLCVVVDRR